MRTISVVGALLFVVGCGDGATVGDPEYQTEIQCAEVPACDSALPDFGEEEGFDHTGSSFISHLPARHRGRDLLLTPDEPQWIIGKLAYGPTDKDLKDEAVDIWVERGCGAEWEWLGEARTTRDGDHETVLGVEDTGGRVYFAIPEEQALEVGRHRVYLSVRGDRSGAELFIQVAPKGTPVFVSDVDGTLTSSEAAEFGEALIGSQPEAHPHAAEALWALADAGYLPVYVTARPEYGVQRTRDFLATHGFPPGLVRTTLGLTGALGGSAITFKEGELASLAERGSVPEYAFGNTATDAEAYDVSGVDNRFFYQFEDDRGGRSIDDYGEIVAELESLEPVCQ